MDRDTNQFLENKYMRAHKTTQRQTGGTKIQVYSPLSLSAGLDMLGEVEDEV